MEQIEGKIRTVKRWCHQTEVNVLCFCQSGWKKMGRLSGNVGSGGKVRAKGCYSRLED